MSTKRAIVWVVSVVLGVALSYLTIYLFDTTIEKFIAGNFAMLIISIAAFFWIWLDYFLGTKMLPEADDN